MRSQRGMTIVAGLPFVEADLIRIDSVLVIRHPAMGATALVVIVGDGLFRRQMQSLKCRPGQ